MEIYLAIIAGLVGMFGWGLADFFAKKTIDRIGSVKTLLWMQFFGIFPLFFYFLFLNEPVKLDIKIVSLLLLLGIGNISAYLLFYRGLTKGLLSVLAPLFASQSGVAVLVSAFLFGESIEFLRWVGLALIFFGAVLASFQFQKGTKISNLENLAKGVPEVLLGTIIIGFFFPAWDWFLEYQQEGWVASVILLRIIAVVALLIFAHLAIRSKNNNRRIEVKEKNILVWLIFIGLFDALAYIFTAWGYRFTSITSVVVVLSATFSLPTVILARIFLKEKLYLNQLIGVAAIIIGVIILAL